jgi:hypothetical protein
MTEGPDPQAIRDRMLKLEKELGEGVSSGEYVARLLGLEWTDELSRSLGAEEMRTEMLCADWYAKSVAVLPNSHAIFAAMMQGMTFAVAVQQLLDEEGD